MPLCCAFVGRELQNLARVAVGIFERDATTIFPLNSYFADNALL